MVVWHPPTSPWVKVNIYGSVVGHHSVCGGISRENRGSLMGYFAGNFGALSVFEVELFGFILALEHALHHMLVFKNASLVLIRLRNRWHNCFPTGFKVISSHIFGKGNSCADDLANHGYSIQGVWWSTALPDFTRVPFFSDRFGWLKYCFR